ncbi:helix-turn-helix domain-containing protein [Aerococcus urinaeequi]|uniref:helix-turn-helix domain-containing protein n=1 Tax=Aerococcus urinaeequi TaxID=51665 RepID=UPI003B4BE98D
MDKNNIILGNRIKDVRIKRNETLEQFANNIKKMTEGTVNTTKSNVSKWERGLNVPNDRTLTAIAKLGDTTVDMLLRPDDIDFEEFSTQVKKENSKIRSWFDDMISNYFEREKDNNNFENSYEYELNVSLMFAFQEYYWTEERQRLSETKTTILEQVKDILLDDNFSGWLFSFYLFYIDDIEGVIYIDKTVNEILVNIAMENRYVYITYLEKLVDFTKKQLFENSFKIKKKTTFEVEKERTSLISPKEHTLINEKFDEILSTIRKSL